MKLLLLFALLALFCMVRSAPMSTTSRTLILPDYHDNDEETVHDDTKPHENEIPSVVEDDDAPVDDEDETTTTTTTTRRSIFSIPTRNRNIIPSRRPGLTQRTPSMRTTTTTTVAADDEQDENVNTYDGDYKYIRDFRKYVQQLLEDIKKMVRNLTGYQFGNSSHRRPQTYPTNDYE